VRNGRWIATCTTSPARCRRRGNAARPRRPARRARAMTAARRARAAPRGRSAARARTRAGIGDVQGSGGTLRGRSGEF
jgi:hypothetical protein